MKNVGNSITFSNANTYTTKYILIGIVSILTQPLWYQIPYPPTMQVSIVTLNLLVLLVPTQASTMP
jgi:hypothetical protein